MRGLAIAFGFLSRLPVAPGRVDDAELARALAWFPAVGAAFGAIGLGLAHALDAHLSATLVAILIVAASALISGGLHLDGLADVFDGLGGGRGDRARTLAIMRDPRVGAHGVTALVLVIAAKVAAVAALVAAGQGWAIAGAPIAARWAVVPLVVYVPYARPQGTGRAMTDHGATRDVVGATILCALALATLGARTIIPAIAAFGVALAIAAWLYRRLGGLTGDVYGAAIELAEVAFLIAASTAVP